MILPVQTPRLRVFAGPNGSGKSTIKSLLDPKLIELYINPDEIEKNIQVTRSFDFRKYNVSVEDNEWLLFFRNSTLIERANLNLQVQKLTFSDNILYFSDIAINAYWASVIADFIRQKLLKHQKSFTFETVMSSKDKVDLLQKAQKMGYRTYLYFVATEDPDINVSRVNYRVAQGGHNVPQQKIVERYYRSLDLLREAVKYSNRAYIFDNSDSQKLWIAEITDGHTMELKSNSIPNWFSRYLLEK